MTWTKEVIAVKSSSFNRTPLRYYPPIIIFKIPVFSLTNGYLITSMERTDVCVALTFCVMELVTVPSKQGVESLCKSQVTLKPHCRNFSNCHTFPHFTSSFAYFSSLCRLHFSVNKN